MNRFEVESPVSVTAWRATDEARVAAVGTAPTCASRGRSVGSRPSATIYALLVLSIALEVVGTTSMKLSQGFSVPLPSLLVVVCYGGALLAYIHLASRIELGVVYAIWSGAGTALIAAVGVMYFGESLSLTKVGGLALIVAGVSVLSLQTQEIRE